MANPKVQYMDMSSGAGPSETRTEEPPDKGEFKCKYKPCGAVRRTEESLALHRFKHERGNRCQVCNRDYWQPAHLERHLAIHGLNKGKSKEPRKVTLVDTESDTDDELQLSRQTLKLDLVRLENDSSTHNLYKEALKRKSNQQQSTPAKDETKIVYGDNLKIPILKLSRLEDDPGTYKALKKTKDKLFLMNKELNDKVQQKVSPRKEELRCSTCRLYFKDKLRLDTHKAYIHSEYYSALKDKIPINLRISTYNKGELDCLECGRNFKNRRSLRGHLRSHASNFFECPVNGCSTKCSSTRTIQGHLQSAHTQSQAWKETARATKATESSERSASFREPICNALKNTNEYKSVMASLPEKYKIESYPVNVLKCRECGKTLRQRNGLKDHLIIHFDSTPVKCPHEGCGVAFKNIISLQNHYYNQHSRKVKETAKASENNKVLSILMVKDALSKGDENMQRTDPNISVFPCGICHRKLKSQHDLSLHGFIHTEEFHSLKSSVPTELCIESYPKNLLSCRECHKVFGNRRNLSEHLHVHHMSTPVKCPVESCAKMLNNQQSVHAHFNFKHKSYAQHLKKFQCAQCEKIFSRRKKAEKHERSHQLPLKTITKQRFKVSSRRDNFRRPTQKGILQCHYKGCLSKLKDQKCLRQHIRRYHDEKRYKCKFCVKEFCVRNMYNSHLKWTHNTNLVKLGVLKCHERPHLAVCKYKGCGKIIKRSGLTRHVNLYHLNKKYTCAICHKIFLLRAYLIQHELTHNIVQGEARNHKCTFAKCKQKFASHQKLQIHMTLHCIRGIESETVGKQCPLCPKYFQHIKMLTSHIKSTHKKQQCSFICNQTKCNEILQTYSSFKLHFISHSGYEGFLSNMPGDRETTRKCPSCENTFKKKANLQYHFHIKHNQDGSGFKCTICEESFASFSVFENHFMEHAVQPPITNPNSDAYESQNPNDNPSNPTYQDDNQINEQQDRMVYASEEDSISSINVENSQESNEDDERLIFFEEENGKVELRKIKNNERKSQVFEIYTKKWRDDLSGAYESNSISLTSRDIIKATIEYNKKVDIRKKKTRTTNLRNCVDKLNILKGQNVIPEDSESLELYAYGEPFARKLKFVVRRFTDAECALQPFEALELFEEHLEFIEQHLNQRLYMFSPKSRLRITSFIYPENVKILIVGSKGAGKTSLVKQLYDTGLSEEYEPTLAKTYYAKKIYMAEKSYMLEITDTEGCTEFNPEPIEHDIDTNIVIVYDITNIDTYYTASRIMEMIKEREPNSTIVMVGTKVDLTEERAVNYVDAVQYASTFNVHVIETTSKYYGTVARLFRQIISIRQKINDEILQIDDPMEDGPPDPGMAGSQFNLQPEDQTINPLLPDSQQSSNPVILPVEVAITEEGVRESIIDFEFF